MDWMTWRDWTDDKKKTIKTAQGIEVDLEALVKNTCVSKPKQPLYPQGKLAEAPVARPTTRKTICNPFASVIGMTSKQVIDNTKFIRYSVGQELSSSAAILPMFTAQAVSPYITRNSMICTEYTNLKNNIINRGITYKNNTIPSRRGYMAEEWVAGTYNLDAAIKNNSDRAYSLQSTANASADIVFDGKEASLKFYKDAKSSADAQSNPKYGNQVRIIPEDQTDAAKTYLYERSQKNDLRGRSDAAKIQRDTAKLVDDRIRSDNGIESTPLSKENSDKLSKAISGDNNKTVVNKDKINEVLKDTKITEKKNSAILKNTLTGIGVAAAIGLGTGFTIGFLASLAQNGLNPNSIKYAFASGAKQGGAGMASSAGSAAIGLTIGKNITDAITKKIVGSIAVKSVENIEKMVNIGVVGSLTVIAFSIYEFAKLKRMGYSTKESLIRVGKSTALSMTLIVLSVVAQGIWCGSAGMVVSIVAGIIVTGVSLTKIIMDKETSKRITHYTIDLTRPSFV